MKNSTATTVPLPPTPVTIDGDEMVVASRMPAQLLPGEEHTFAIDMTGVGTGEVVRTVRFQNQRHIETFRLMMTVLTAAHAETAVRQAYTRYQEFAAADDQDITISLSRFETIYPPDLSTVRYLSLFDYVQAETLNAHVLSRGTDFDGIVSYSPAWKDLATDQIAADAARAQSVENWTVMDLLAYAEGHDFPVPELIAVTSYEVGIEFADRSRHYKAAFLWAADDHGVFIHDMVLKDLGRVRAERRLPVSQATIEHDDHPLSQRWKGPESLSDSCPPGSKRCHVWSSASPGFNRKLIGRQQHDLSADPDGKHSSEYQTRGSCQHTSCCVNRCAIGPIVETCEDTGPLVLPPAGDRFTHIPFSILGSVERSNGYLAETTCQVRFGCAVARCLLGICVESISFSIAGHADIETIPHNRPIYNLSQIQLNTCTPPIECDPDSTDNGGEPEVPGGFCEDAVGFGYWVTVDAALRAPSHLDIPFDGWVELSLITDDPTISIDPLRLTRSGVEYPFSERIPDGTNFHIEIAAKSSDVICDLMPTSEQTIAGSDHRGVSVVSCTQIAIPEGCPQNPTDCIAPPNGCEVVFAGWIGQFNIETGNSGSVDGTIVVDGVEMFQDWATTVSRTIDVVVGGLRCQSSEGSTGFNKSTTMTLGPILYSRNDHDEPVSGEVVIWGVARDDVYGVSEVEVYLDGQLAPLSQFAFNLNNTQTCSEHITGEPCDSTSSYYGILDTSHLSPGRHPMVINATNTAGVSSVIATEILVAAPTQPEVHLKVSYLPEGGSSRTIYTSSSADPQTPVRFRYDETQGTYHERIGGACDSGTDNPTYLKVRLGGDSDFRMDACEIRGSWDSQWYPCTQGLVDDVNNREYIVLTTDSHLYAPCNFDDPIAPHIGTEQPAWFKVRFIDDGLVYERRIDMVKAP